jgi:hypothetical protein
MVLKAAAEDALAASEQRSRDRIPWLRFDRPVMKPKFHPQFSPGKKDSRTSLEIVFRTACNHCRQPER